jgi:hypothetical protein
MEINLLLIDAQSRSISSGGSRNQLRFRGTGVVLCLFYFLFAGNLLVAQALHVEEPNSNAGRIYTGQKLTRQFTFTNRGPDDVEIIEAKASCGCLAPKVSTRLLKPGEQGTASLDVNTLTQAAGPQSWTLRLVYRSGGKSNEETLRLSAHLVAEVSVQPATLVVFADKAANHEITVSDVRSEPFQITEIRSSRPELKPVLRTVPAQGKSAWRIKLEVTPEFPDGRHEEAILICTNDRQYAELRVPVTILKHVQQRLSATPREVQLTAPPGQTFPSRIVLVRDEQDGKVHIDHIMSDHPALTCRWAPGPNNLATLKIQVDRKLLQSPELQTAIHISIDQPIKEKLTIPIRCRQE